jgi:hypothetical protein
MKQTLLTSCGAVAVVITILTFDVVSTNMLPAHGFLHYFVG